jgi:phage gpG-like protein
VTIKADFSGADKKMQALFRMEGATKKALTAAMGMTVKRAKYNATRSILTAKTGHLGKNIGGEVKEPAKGFFEVGIGTGNLIGRTEVKYAAIHEFGGTITAKRYWKTHTRGFGLEPRYIKKLCFKTRDDKWHMVDKVTIPARHWLSRSIQESEGYFMQALSPKNLLREMDYPERED